MGRHRKVRTRQRIPLLVSATAVVAAILGLAYAPQSSTRPATSSAPARTTPRTPGPIASAVKEPLPRTALADPDTAIPPRAEAIDDLEAREEPAAFRTAAPARAADSATPTTVSSLPEQSGLPPTSRHSPTPIEPAGPGAPGTCLLCFLGHAVSHLPYST